MDTNMERDIQNSANRHKGNVLPWQLGSSRHQGVIWLQQWRAWRQQAKTRLFLSQLPDHLLRDIGLHHADLRRIRGSHQSTDFLHRLF